LVTFDSLVIDLRSTQTNTIDKMNPVDTLIIKSGLTNETYSPLKSGLTHETYSPLKSIEVKNDKSSTTNNELFTNETTLLKLINTFQTNLSHNIEQTSSLKSPIEAINQSANVSYYKDKMNDTHLSYIYFSSLMCKKDLLQ
jgi:hypothetical protein